MFKSLSLAVASLAAVFAFTAHAAFSADDAQAVATPGKTQNTIQNVSIAKTGTFKGLSRHVTKGSISIVQADSGYIVLLESDFSLDGAPAPSLGFGKDGKFDPATEFTQLAGIKGAQVYAVPSSINPLDFNEFYVWCADFTVPLGVAALK